MTRRDVDERILRLANSQHGVFTWQQIQPLGATATLASRRVDAGYWSRLARGVYALTASPPTWRRRLKAAELSVPGSVVAGRSALRLHELPGGATGLPQLVVEPTGPRTTKLARVRRSGCITSRWLDGFRVVSVEQAVFDVGGDASLLELERMIDHALLEGQASVPRFEAMAAARSGSRPPGIEKLRVLIAERASGFVVPESELERLLYRVLEEAGVPAVVRQVHPPWSPDDRRRFDAVSIAWRVIFEADGRRWHARMSAFERDRRRDLEAAAHGYLTIRLTWAQLTMGRHEVIDLIRSAGLHRAQAA